VTEITVSSACKYLGVSTSGYYAWRKRQIYVNQKYTNLKTVYWEHHARLTESFFHTLKGHVAHDSVFINRKKPMLYCLNILKFTTIESDGILQMVG
jgi:hypothetical protein